MKKYMLLVLLCLLVPITSAYGMKRAHADAKRKKTETRGTKSHACKKLGLREEDAGIERLKRAIFQSNIETLRHVVVQEKENTPLLAVAAHYAIKQKNAAALEIIVDENVQVVDEEYEDPYLFIPYTNKLLGVAIIEYCNCAYREESLQAKQCIELVITKKPDFNIKIADYYYHSNETAPVMHYGVSFSNTQDLMQLLLKNGADVNQRNSYDETPLHIITSIDNAQLFCQHGANVNARDSCSVTPLMNALYHKKHKADETADRICLLLEHGADILRSDAYGLTARNHYFEIYQSSSGDSDEENSTENSLSSSQTEETPILSLVTKGRESAIYHEYSDRKRKEYISSVKVPILTMLRNRELGL